MKLGIPVYQDVNLLDVTAPLEMFYWASKIKTDFEAVLISEDGKAVTSINGVRFDVQASFAEMPALDIVWVPGGTPEALKRIMRDPDSAYLKYLRQIAPNATWICSVCEGALLLARAGLLDGHAATTHWAFVNCLKKFPAIKVDTTYKRFVVSDNRLTGGGISSGLDESLELIRRLFGDDVAKDVQRTTQYFPEPPVDAQLPALAPPCQMVWD
jgi:cyclohexyl-isocyanide hydratase